MRDKLEEYLKKLTAELAYWEFKEKHNVWIDDGKGGCIKHSNMILITKGKIEAVMYLLKSN